MKNLIKSSKNWVKRTVGPIVRASGSQHNPHSIEKWGLTALPAQGLCLRGVPLAELTKRWGSPLHVVDAQRLRENVAAFSATPQGAQGGCEVYYSYKSNPVPGVLRLMHDAGVGAEVISHYEFWLARKLGMPGNRIVYNGPAKSPQSIREAIESDILVLNINHREEIALVASIARELKKRVRVGLRVNTGHGWAAQFGTPIDAREAFSAFRAALNEPWLDVVGVHAHRGGMIHYEHELVPFVQRVLEFLDVLDAELEFRPSILNFGGSLATPTVEHLRSIDQRLNQTFGRRVPAPNSDDSLTIERYIKTLVGTIESHFQAKQRPRPRIFVEPGRAMTGNTQLLLTSIMTIKEAAETTYAIMDAGINHAESVRNEYHEVLPVNLYGTPATRRYTLVGPICTPGDTLYASRYLPTLSAGDTLAIMDAGAYFVPFSTSFSFPRPAIVMLDGGREELLRRAETFEDIVRYDNL